MSKVDGAQKGRTDEKEGKKGEMALEGAKTQLNNNQNQLNSLKDNSRQFSNFEVDIKGDARPRRLILRGKVEIFHDEKQLKHKDVSEKIRHGNREL